MQNRWVVNKILGRQSNEETIVIIHTRGLQEAHNFQEAHNWGPKLKQKQWG